MRHALQTEADYLQQPSQQTEKASCSKQAELKNNISWHHLTMTKQRRNKQLGVHKRSDSGDEALRQRGFVHVCRSAANVCRSTGFVMPRRRCRRDPSSTCRLPTEVGAMASTLSFEYTAPHLLPQHDMDDAVLKVCTKGWHLIFYVQVCSVRQPRTGTATYWVCRLQTQETCYLPCCFLCCMACVLRLDSCTFYL